MTDKASASDPPYRSLTVHQAAPSHLPEIPNSKASEPDRPFPSETTRDLDKQLRPADWANRNSKYRGGLSKDPTGHYLEIVPLPGFENPSTRRLNT